MHTAECLRRSWVGDWEQLAAEANANWPLGKPTKKGKDSDGKENQRKLVSRVVNLVAQGEVSKAAAMFTSTGVAAATDATFQQLCEMIGASAEGAAPNTAPAANPQQLHKQSAHIRA